jgi:hypothetical protein
MLLQGTEAVDVTRAKLTRQLAERTTNKMQVHSSRKLQQILTINIIFHADKK